MIRLIAANYKDGLRIARIIRINSIFRAKSLRMFGHSKLLVNNTKALEAKTLIK